MKKVLFSKALIALSLLFVLSSCNDDESIIGGGTVAQSDEDAIALANGALANFRSFGSGYSFLVESLTEGTISFEGEESEDGPELSRFEVKPTNFYIVRVYSVQTLAIAAANDAIEKISNSTKVSESTKKVTIARAKFVRALAYSYLVQLFGEVPINLEVGTSVKTRASIDEVYTQIVKDLVEAEVDLPDYDSSPLVISKSTANALLARVYLTWGSNPVTQTQLATIANNQTDPAKSFNDSRLAKAIEYADKVILSGKFSLLQDYTKLFGRANESKAPEHIFTIEYDGVNASNHQTHCSFTFGFNVEQDNHIGPSNIEAFRNWDEADNRRDYSYTTVLQNPEENNREYYFLPPVTLPRFGKFIDRTYENSVNLCITNNDIDRIEIRYAEVLLTKAEALVNLGRNEEAVNVINQLRERAFGDSSHNLSSVTIEDVQREWGYEYVYEQKHWFNLVRWKNLVSTVKTVEGFEYFDSSYAVSGQTGRDGSTVNAFFAKVNKHLHAKYDNVRAKHYRFPIPVGESGEDLGVTPQNPGY